jgi:hypothetical protein
MSEAKHGIFLRLEAYGLIAAARKTSGNTLQKVAGEVMRVQGYCDHVKRALLPNLVYGDSPWLLVKEHEDRSLKTMSRYLHKPTGTFRTRRQRRDRPVAVAGVISVPDDWKQTEQRWQFFKEACTAWLQLQFDKEHLHCVIEHVDERCLHLHFFLNPLEYEDISCVHPGFHAVRSLDISATPRQKKAAFENGMRGLLDRFHAEVGQRFGFVRKHIGAKRMSRKDWHIWNWYQQRERLQQERLGEVNVIARGNELLPQISPLVPLVSDVNVSADTDVGLVVPTTKFADVANIRVSDGKSNGSGFLVQRKMASSTEVILSDLSSSEPAHDYSWLRPSA